MRNARTPDIDPASGLGLDSIEADEVPDHVGQEDRGEAGRQVQYEVLETEMAPGMPVEAGSPGDPHERD